MADSQGHDATAKAGDQTREDVLYMDHLFCRIAEILNPNFVLAHRHAHRAQSGVQINVCCDGNDVSEHQGKQEQGSLYRFALRRIA